MRRARAMGLVMALFGYPKVIEEFAGTPVSSPRNDLQNRLAEVPGSASTGIDPLHIATRNPALHRVKAAVGSGLGDGSGDQIHLAVPWSTVPRVFRRSRQPLSCAVDDRTGEP